MELTVLKEDLHFHLYVKKQPIEIGLSFFFFVFVLFPTRCKYWHRYLYRTTKSTTQFKLCNGNTEEKK